MGSSGKTEVDKQQLGRPWDKVEGLLGLESILWLVPLLYICLHVRIFHIALLASCDCAREVATMNFIHRFEQLASQLFACTGF